MITVLKNNVKKFTMAFVAALMLVSCGGDFVGELVTVYETGASTVASAKTPEELAAAVADVNQKAATILNENKEEWEDMVQDNKNDSTEYAEEFAALSVAQAKYMGAIKAKEAELNK
jgi:hypothetical protein